MAREKVKIKDSVSIRKTSSSKKGGTVKTYFFPDMGESVEASSQEEALKILKKRSKK